MARKNEIVILCERGIRTFENYTRNTLDISAVPVFKRLSHLPVVVDPSHAAGIPWLVEPLSLAAVAAGADGLIIDVRNNGGGNLTNATRMAQRFTNEKVLTGYIQHKTGKGHSDFSDPTPIYVEPSNSIRWQKKVIVLTNRHSYSATSDFVNSMRCFPNVTLVGDKTGGGSGLPFSSELPNGWGVRFSASPHLDAQKQHIEFGIDPDKKVDMSKEDENNDLDTIIEEARKILKVTF